MEHIPDTRARNRLLAELRKARADAAEAKATQTRAHESAVRTFCDGVARLGNRLDVLELKHADQKRRKAKAKAQREKQAIADYINRLPDPDNPAVPSRVMLTIMRFPKISPVQYLPLQATTLGRHWMSQSSKFRNRQPSNLTSSNMGMTREQILQMHASARVYQQRFDSAFEPWGMRAKSPVIGEDVNEYRRSLAVQGKRLLPENHKLRAVQYRALKADIYEVLEPQLLKAVAESSWASVTLLNSLNLYPGVWPTSVPTWDQSKLPDFLSSSRGAMNSRGPPRPSTTCSPRVCRGPGLTPEVIMSTITRWIPTWSKPYDQYGLPAVQTWEKSVAIPDQVATPLPEAADSVQIAKAQQKQDRIVEHARGGSVDNIIYLSEV
jgi:hypothetical protein